MSESSSQKSGTEKQKSGTGTINSGTEIKNQEQEQKSQEHEKKSGVSSNQSGASSQKSGTDKKKTEEKPRSLKDLLDDDKIGDSKTDTKKSKKDKNPFSDITKNFRSFNKYFNDLRNAYEDEFQKLEKGKEKDIFTLRKKFESKMPYISGAKKIESSSIQMPDKKFFMKNIFIEIINSFKRKNDYPGEKKCGLAYLDNSEWIYYNI